MKTRRIVLLGKTGAGKSNLANTIFEEDVFKVNHGANSGTKECQAETKSVKGRSITLIDTPGFFDTDMSEEDLKPEWAKCITKCAPGPHAFLIVLKVERFTKHEKAVIKKIREYFSVEAFKYAAVVFTHGDQLDEGKTIEEFIKENKCLRDLVKKCGNRYHVIDNKYWKNNNPQDEYRSNQRHVAELLNTVDKIVKENDGSYYTNEMLQAVEEQIQQEMKRISLMSENKSVQEIRVEAKVSFFEKFLIGLAETATFVLLGALFGVTVMVGKTETPAAAILKLVIKGIAGAAAGHTLPAAPAVAGAVTGGKTGHAAAEKASTPQKASRRAAEAVKVKAKSHLD